MKFYISSRYKKKDEVKIIKEIIESKGHSLTYDWTDTETFRPYSQNKDKTKEMADKNIEGVKNSDIFILITDDGGTDMYVELGMALSNFLEKGKPKIYILGEHLEKSSFYFHPAINIVKSFNEIKEI